jgi:ribulose 1,5-bisphosphate carboxylase large subunit-like protein
MVAEELKNDNRDFRSILANIMKTELRMYGKQISKLLPTLLKKGLPDYTHDEFKLLNEAINIIKEEFSADVKIIRAKDSKESKAKQAMPGKPAIIVG